MPLLVDNFCICVVKEKKEETDLIELSKSNTCLMKCANHKMCGLFKVTVTLIPPKPFFLFELHPRKVRNSHVSRKLLSRNGR